MIHITPFGNRILVKRRKVGEKAGSIYLPDSAKERDTDLADIVATPELSFADEELIKNAEAIIISLTKFATEGQSEALIALLRLKDYLNVKTLRVGETVMISKYVGTTFHDTHKPDEELTLVDGDNVIGVVHND